MFQNEEKIIAVDKKTRSENLTKERYEDTVYTILNILLSNTRVDSKRTQSLSKQVFSTVIWSACSAFFF